MIDKIKVFNKNEICNKIRRVKEQMIFRCKNHRSKNEKESHPIN